MIAEEDLKKLSFECTQCGGCCGKAPGYVRVSMDEVKGIANLLNLSVYEFLFIFIRKIVLNGTQFLSLKEKPNYDCVFLENNRCQIYSERPLQCRSYPFWPNIVESLSQWENEKKNCPGIGKGAAVNPEKVYEWILLQRKNENL